MVAEVAAAVRERRVSAVDLVTMSLERIDRLDPPLGAVTAVFPERALEAARALDERGAEGRLAGLPLLVKDTTDVQGLVTNFGSRTMLDRPPAQESELTIERMVAEGAIVVGRTNVPEFAFQGWTANDVFGATRNPWALEWSPGGSSGGSGAALAAGLAPLATGTDGGGSIRTPATFCGLVGLKPTSGAVGRRPIPSWLETSTHGPMATSIADARLLFEIMRGPVAGDPTAPPLSRASRGAGSQTGTADRPDELRSRVFAIHRTWDLGPLPDDVREPFRAVLDTVDAELGIPVEEIRLEQLWPTA